MRKDDRPLADGQRVERRDFRRVREIGDDAERVHPLDALASELGQAGPGLLNRSATPQIVVVVGDLQDAKTQLVEMLQPCQVVADWLAALKLKEDRRAPGRVGIPDSASAGREKGPGNRAVGQLFPRGVDRPVAGVERSEGTLTLPSGVGRRSAVETSLMNAERPDLATSNGLPMNDSPSTYGNGGLRTGACLPAGDCLPIAGTTAGSNETLCRNVRRFIDNLPT